jgi:hypothetical protein
MHTDRYTKTVLTFVAVLLAVIALRPAAAPSRVLAQPGPQSLFVEPGYTMLRKPDGTAQLKGKVVINLNTGEIWGFPTLVDGPYPVDISTPNPPVSKPMYLGKFDFTALDRP